MMNIVVLQRSADSKGFSDWRIGTPDRLDPKTDQPLISDGEPYRTHNNLCACGEMLGTARKRYKYGPNRWPATVTAMKCDQCGHGICDRCCYWHKTNEYTDFKKRRTEGGHLIGVPNYKYKHLCRSCSESHAAEHANDKRVTTEDVLRSLGFKM